MKRLKHYCALLAALLLALSACGQAGPAPGAASNTGAAPTESSSSAPFASPTADDIERAAAPTLVAAGPSAAEAVVTTAPQPSGGAGGEAEAALPMYFDTVFEGAIDNQYPVQMQLYRDGAKLFGSYFYKQVQTAPGEPQQLQLSGRIEDSGQFRLEEFDGETPTGLFVGALQLAPGPNRPLLRLEGTWSKAADAPQLPFTLLEQRVAVGDKLQMISVATKTEDPANKVVYAATFPRLAGVVDTAAEGFNAQVDALVQRALDGYKSSIGQYLTEVPQSSDSLGSSINIRYHLLTATPALISVLFEEMTYVAGAAHPNHATFVLNYDLANGRSLALADLFKPGAPYLAALSAYCVARLQERDIGAWVDGAAPEPENYKSWNIQPEGLRITFDPYQVAAYAAGHQTVVVPYTELSALIEPDGPLAPFLR